MDAKDIWSGDTQSEFEIIAINQEQQFESVVSIIQQHRSRASQAINSEALLAAWHVGAFVSAKIKAEEWGSKVVNLLSQYIRAKHPDLKGYSRTNIYNMVMFYEEYSSARFADTAATYLPNKFVQSLTGQFPEILNLTTLTNHITILKSSYGG